MKRFIVTEEERKDILNLYKENVIKESTSCICPNGSIHPSCCGGGQTFNLSSMSVEDREKVLKMANEIISQNKSIQKANAEAETKSQINQLTTQITQLINNLNNKNTRAARKAIQSQLETYNKQLAKLTGNSEESKGPGGDDDKRTTDAKVNSWIKVFESLLAAISAGLLFYKKLGSSGSSGGSDDGSGK